MLDDSQTGATDLCSIEKGCQPFAQLPDESGPHDGVKINDTHFFFTSVK